MKRVDLLVSKHKQGLTLSITPCPISKACSQNAIQLTVTHVYVCLEFSLAYAIFTVAASLVRHRPEIWSRSRRFAVCTVVRYLYYGSVSVTVFLLHSKKLWSHSRGLFKCTLFTYWIITLPVAFRNKPQQIKRGFLSRMFISMQQRSSPKRPNTFQSRFSVAYFDHLNEIAKNI